ncbi:MAG: hypothetical protein OXB92_15885 [Acidimicrobiaceae bacterium]|nr:hypothetical protein [Acidimicrobiaceae bacterium]
MTTGRRFADTGTSDVVDAHLAVVAEGLGTVILTGDPDDMSRLNARFEIYRPRRTVSPLQPAMPPPTTRSPR